MLSKSKEKESIVFPEALSIAAFLLGNTILHESTAYVESIIHTEAPVSINV